MRKPLDVKALEEITREIKKTYDYFENSFQGISQRLERLEKWMLEKENYKDVLIKTPMTGEKKK